MAITSQQVDEIAELARLSLSQEEKEALPQELSRILEHVETLQALDTSGISPMSHPSESGLRLRRDEAGAVFSPATALAQAPATQDNCFRVPHVIAKD